MVERERLLIKGGLLALPGGDWQQRDLLIDDGIIVGLDADIRADDARLVDAGRRLVAPGLINAHTHSPSNLTKGTGDRLSHPAFMWLNQADTAQRTPREIYLSAMLGCIEMLLTGTTACIDHFPEQNFGLEDVAPVVEAYRDAGLRVAIALRLFDGDYADIYPPADQIPPALRDQLARVDPLKPRPVDELIELCDAALARWRRYDPRIALFPAISNPCRCTDALLERAGALAERYDTGLHTHLLETKVQGEIAQRLYGTTQVRHLDALGLLSKRLSCAHTIWIDEPDIALLAERGAVVVHNPDSNLKIGAGIAPIPSMLAHGVTVALGTDGASTSYSLALQNAMKVATIVHRAALTERARWVTVADVFDMATLGGAKAMQLDGRIGVLQVGAAADLVLYDLDRPAWTPLKQPLEQFVFCDTAATVRMVIIDGRVLVENGRITAFDADGILAEARACLPRIRDRNRALYDVAAQMAEIVP
ncbi:MAG: amidohydrolase family protein [Pseudomonadota bacterium]